MIKNITIVYVLLIALVVSVLGFRGAKSSREPIFIFPDMDWQNKYQPQQKSGFFENRMTDRLLPANTVVRGNALDRRAVFDEDYSGAIFQNTALLHGREADGSFTTTFPMEVSHDLMMKGRERYDIFCAVCHGHAGEGNGAIRLFEGPNLVPSNLNQGLFVNQPDGEIYNTIVHGKNTMMGYGDKLNLEERWAVVLYVRALQQAANAGSNDIPDGERGRLGL
jgi:mono/diheme cytochrome c family protein